jgi:DNA-binding NtrC family response regulator
VEVLRRHSWPGNVRELQSVVKHAILQSVGPVIVPECLPESLHATPAGAAEAAPCTDLDRFVDARLQAEAQELYTEWLSLAEGQLFRRVLRHTGGNLSWTARILGIHRATLRGKLAALGIKPEDSASPEAAEID